MSILLRGDNVPPPDESSLWMPEDVARELQVPISWVYRTVKGRNKKIPVLPHVKVGVYLRFEPVAVRAYWQALRNQPNTCTSGQARVH